MTGGLVERDLEIRALERSLIRSRAGMGSVVVLDAAPGLGKTALLRHARDFAAASGATVLSARGAQLERDFTFGVVRQLFEPALPRDATERAVFFTGAAQATEGLFAETAVAPGAEAATLFPLLNGLYWLLVSLSERAPVVVLVDDAQWADQPSLRFLGFLARRVESVAVTVVVTTRAAEQGDDGHLDDIMAAGEVTLLEPRHLTLQGAAQLIRREFGPGADDAFCAACHATTSGNPLFLRELLRVLVSDAVRPDAAAVTAVHDAGPDAVRRYVTARLRRQPEEAQRVARAVAILGDDVTLALVARQAGLPPAVTSAAAERLVQHGVFERHDPPAFTHAVVRDVVLGLVPPARRGAEHERAAAVLRAADEPVERVASHLLRTVPAGDAGHVTLLLAAAEQARQRGATGIAAVYLARARAEPPEPGLRSEVSRRLGNCQVHELALAEAEANLSEALNLAEDPRQGALCAYSLARFRNACGEPGKAVVLLTQAAAELPPEEDPVLAAELAAELIGIARIDLPSRAMLTERLTAFRDLPGRSDAVLNAQLSMEALFAGGPSEEAVAPARAALAGDRLTPERPSIWAALHTMIVTDRLDEAEQRLHQALRTAVDRGILFPMGMIHAYLARISLLRGDLAQAEDHVEQGTRAAPTPNFALPSLQSTAVHLLIEQDRPAEAEQLLESSVLAGGGGPRTALQLWLLDARTRLRAEQGDDEAALADALTCARVYQQWGASKIMEVPWRLHAARACLRTRDRARAAELVEAQLRRARSFGVPRHIAVALRAAADLATDEADARRLLSEAVSLLDGGPARLELARTQATLGERLLAGGDRQAAGETIQRAAELALECHAPALAERLGALLTETAGGRAPRLRVGGAHALTPSERQVAQLAATALTNRQIAERLFVSEKTVEAHLSRTYRKLGVRTRTQLALQLAPLPAAPLAGALV
ncbi:AAA family ATPase [Streptosporangium sp. NBC_01495]|uniref:ATP-binding protein n=1 Tax=Streptosporangium sp. NBC_01495 TaxID=2903899 RepID=UPI002E33922C|nr:AAA family ATPase [Streptosporangium sp. NBC_01495]